MVIGQTSIVPISVSVDEALPPGNFIVNATTWSQGLQIMMMQGDVCEPANGVLHLGRMYLGRLHYTGLRCYVEKGPLFFSIQLTLTPPFYAARGYKSTVTNLTRPRPALLRHAVHVRPRRPRVMDARRRAAC